MIHQLTMKSRKPSLIFFILYVSWVAIQLVDSFSIKKDEVLKYSQDLEDYIEDQKQFVNPRYRQKYHISAPVGWINDPNGFSYFNKEYHMFYQFHPYSAYWGPMHWGHMRSKNLVDWEYLPTALIPGDEFDKDGCFSGSALDVNGTLVLFYSGHLVENGRERQIKNLATSIDGVHFEKYVGNPVIPVGPNDVDDFRDPKVWKHGNYWYMIIGNRTPDFRGRAVLYRSLDIINWDYIGVLAETLNAEVLGFMWECPDFFELNGKYVLLLSPQGMAPSGDRYQNLYQTGYYIGTFDYNTHVYTIENEVFEELDFGYDFYAAQTTESEDGRRIVVGWMDMWESEFKEREDNWAGTLSLPRELSLGDDGKIRMRPARELELLRETINITKIVERGAIISAASNNIEVIAKINIPTAGLANVVGIDFLISETETLHLFFDPATQQVTLDRAKGDGIRRAPWSPTGILEWRIFIDSSSIEVFCGDGERVFSSRIYPSHPVRMRTIGAAISYEIYSIRQSIES